VKNEKLTRKEIIDNRLKQAGWNVTDRTQVIEEFDIHLTVVEKAGQLAEEFHNEQPHITIELLRKVYNHRKAELVQFIKHILGISPLETFAETVTKAFDEFVAKHSYLSSRQLRFLELLKKFVLEKGDVSKRNLIESPFTMLHPDGIIGIFNQREIEDILSLQQQVLVA